MMDMRATPRLLFYSGQHMLAENAFNIFYPEICENQVTYLDRHPVTAFFHAKAAFEFHHTGSFFFYERAEAFDNLRCTAEEARAPYTDRYCHHG
jgi:hypothetical protein